MNDDLLEALNHATAFAYNWQWLTGAYSFSLVMAAVVFIAWRLGDQSAVWMAAGAALAEWGAGTHRTYWMLAGLFAPAGKQFAPEITAWKWALYFDIQITLLGMIMMARPLLLPRLKDRWLVTPMLAFQLVFAVAFSFKLQALLA